MSSPDQAELPLEQPTCRACGRRQGQMTCAGWDERGEPVDPQYVVVGITGLCGNCAWLIRKGFAVDGEATT